MRVRTTVLAIATLLVAHGVAAQTAAEILRTAQDRYEQRIAGIDNFTVVQNANGMRVSVYFEKQMQDGHPVLVPEVMGGDMAAMPGGQRQQRVATAEMMGRMIDGARLTGTGEIDGRSVWIIRTENVPEMGMAQEGFQPTSLTMHLDQQDYVPLLVESAGELTTEGGTHPVTLRTRLEDYREVEGLLHPFRTVVTVEGFAGAMSDAERAEMQQQMQEMQEQLESMPPEQRRMFEQQMRNMPQMRQMMEQMEAMAAGKDMEVTIEVEELRVNEGPPSGP